MRDTHGLLHITVMENITDIRRLLHITVMENITDTHRLLHITVKKKKRYHRPQQIVTHYIDGFFN